MVVATAVAMAAMAVATTRSGRQLPASVTVGGGSWKGGGWSVASGRSVARACDCAWGMDLSSSHQLTRGLRRLWRECVTTRAKVTEKTNGEGLDRLVAAPLREGGGLLQMEEHMVDREAHGWVGTPHGGVGTRLI